MSDDSTYAAHGARARAQTYRQGSFRRLGHGGSPAGALTLETTGSTRLDGMVGENAIDSVAVPVDGCVSSNDQIGCVPFGAAIVTFIREPVRYTWPSK
jgi:hypothetical protein